MRAAAYVGRIGGLAVGLGIGIATGGFGVAGATPADSSDSTASVNSSATAPSSTSSPAARSNRGRMSLSASAAVSGGQRRAALATHPNVITATDVPSVGVSAPTLMSPSPAPVSADRVRLPGLFTSKSIERRDTSAAAPRPIPAGSVADVPQMGAAPAAPVAASGVVEAVFPTVLGSNPDAPEESPVSWVALAAARSPARMAKATAGASNGSSIAALFFNETPILTATQISQSGSGIVQGVLNSFDPDSSSLTYSITQDPAKGTVVLGQDGSYTYTPNAPLPSYEFIDYFTATASDAESGFHIHGLGGLLNLLTFGLLGFNGHTAAIEVAIVIPPSGTGNAPPTATVSVGAPDPTTGIIFGQVNGSDSNGDSLTYSGTSTTSKGSVGVNASTGAFTYTPTAAARQNAANPQAGSFDKLDTFTVTVSDSNGGSLAVPVNVPVSPLVENPNNSPPVARATTIGIADPTTGLVKGRINATDPNGDVLTYLGSAATPKGSVIIDDTTGEFSYTPTADARQNASDPSATSADKVDSFTVTVDDGNGRSVAVPVTVPISPTITVVHNTVIATVKVGGSPYKVAVSPDGTRAYVTNAGTSTVSVIDTASNAVTATISVGGGPVGIAISPDGATAYVTDVNGTTAAVVRTSDNTVIGSIDVGEYPYGAVVSADGKTVYFANIGGSVAKIDTATQSAVRYNLGGALYDIAVNRDGKTFYVADVSNHQVLVKNTVTNTVARIPVGNNPYGMAISPDGTRIYVANRLDGTVSVISTVSNRVGTTIAVGSAPWGVAVSPDGKTVYVVNGASNTVSVIRTSDNTVTATIPVGSGPSGVAFSPDGQRAYVTNKWDFTVSVISV